VRTLAYAASLGDAAMFSMQVRCRAGTTTPERAVSYRSTSLRVVHGGTRSRVYPAPAEVPAELFGICVAHIA
jgi:hypothetical protein